MAPTTRKALRRQPGNKVGFVNEAIPAIGSSDTLIRVRAVSLNYKDAAIADGSFPYPGSQNSIVGSEFAGEIHSIGEKVTNFKVGDRVMSLINYNSVTGNEEGFQALGQNIDGTLAEYIVIPESVLVKIPKNLSWAEASMVPCSGITAWNALNMTSRLLGKTVLLQGTGGTSIISLVLAARAGANVIVTSSSDAKLERTKALGATHTINYVKNPEWEKEVLKLTNGVGVDIVIDQGGAGSFLQSAASLKKGGQLSQVGFLSAESKGSFEPLIAMLIFNMIKIVGIQTGTKVELEEFAGFLGASRFSLAPCIDKVYSFDNAIEAMDHLRGSSLFGKVIVEMP